MAKQYRTDYDHSLAESGQWLKFVKSLNSGIYEVSLPSFSRLRSLQATCSKVNTDADHPYKITTRVKYQEVVLRIEVDKK